MSAMDWITFLSSTTLRLLAYGFLRWIPGHGLPLPIVTTFVVYLISALPRFFQTKPYSVLVDQIDVITRETVGRHDDEDDTVVLGLEDVDENGESVKELDVEETIILEENDPKIFRTLLTGIPSPASLFWSVVTATINLALVLMVLDLTFTGKLFHESNDLSLARVGYVSDKTASILVREPKSAHYPIILNYRHADKPMSGGRAYDTSWKSAGSIAHLDNTTDFTGAFEIKGLVPDTRYQYSVFANHSGFFTTAPVVGHTSAKRGDTFTFLHSSCIKPNFPYVPLKHPLSMPGFKQLAKVLPSLKAQFMIFLGDFIYVDVPHRFGVDVETYRREYRQVYASPDWPSVSSALGSELPWIHVYDDHEIANDWDRNETGVYQSAADPWQHYQASVNPPAVRYNASYFSFKQGPASFFMIDTRRYREPFDGTNGTWDFEAGQQKSMLGTQQREDLLAWLAQSEPAGVRWKILITSIPFTKNWRFGSEDTWAGYLGERQVILEAMWDVGLRGGVGVVILSGDRHEFAATSFPPPSEGKVEGLDLGYAGQGLQQGLRVKKWPASAVVHEFSTSPLSMFYLPVRTYRQDDEDDVCIKYIPDGNYKFGALTITNPHASDQSLLHYRLFVDGEETWSHTVMTPPAVSGAGRGKDAIWA